MKLIKINPQKPEKDKIELALNILREGGVVVYPTDTLYGIGVNIFNEDAVERVFSIKKRSRSKPLSVCLPKVESISKVAYMDSETEKIVRKLLPGPFTLILNKKECISSTLTAGEAKIGVRIPDSRVSMELSREFPVTATSANISGMKVPESSEGVYKQIGGSVDLILDAGTFKESLPSTVVDLTCRPPSVIRRGSGVELFDEIIEKIK
ncbi:L-threonylcarbamoyladenylate synthase [Methanobacterium congolense]|uniref:L-threonylcarbamoyladenylate synthase n=1 Tax=Methanobacterium congolense TaxID=118062 RepID=A0A1D3L3G3_9EURY|nr:L-threonylcarbamoyladenylate synthase [Methanobacterium congolense]SCG86194.1 putative threonylcarbamoyl-AMP synthase [Methanobacterium congolense]